MLIYQIGDLVILTETVEWDDLVIIKGEICIISQVHDTTDPLDDIFFDYTICAGDGTQIDVWHGEIERISDVAKI